MAQVTVQDFGTGIPENFRGRIFERFAQSDESGAVRRQGTGLGLSIARKLVEAMGGTIGFETETGRGTAFRFTLPCAAATAKPSDAGQGPEAPDTPDTPNTPDTHPDCRILVCEDDRDVAKLLALLLQRAGFAAETVHDLAGARNALRRGGFAAMTLDIALPDGDGLEFLSELRSDPATKGLPVVIVSGAVERGNAVGETYPVELVDWISKPIDEATLVRALHWATRNIQREIPRILHVEDNDDLRHVLSDLFKGQAEWVGAATLREARALLKREPFDLIVLDLTMPDGTGLELMENAETLSGRPVPVLILSASEPADAELRKRVGAILLKSRVSEEHIVRTVLNLVRKGPAA